MNKTHKGVKVTFDPIKLVLEDDTNGYFKPMFPYHGRVRIHLLHMILYLCHVNI